MRIVLAVGLVVSSIACGGGDDYKVVGDDTTHPGSGSHPDAFVPDSSDGALATVSGRVCLVSDPRSLAACAGSGVAGVIVSDGSASVLAADDGQFVVAGSAGVIEVSGSDAAGSAIAPGLGIGGDGLEIPALREDLYATMLDDTGVLVPNGDGAVLARVRRGGSAAQGVIMGAVTADTVGFYDSSDPTTWSSNESVGTGPFGDAWLPAVQEGTADLSFADASGAGSATTISGVPIIAGVITFLDVTVP